MPLITVQNAHNTETVLSFASTSTSRLLTFPDKVPQQTCVRYSSGSMAAVLLQALLLTLAPMEEIWLLVKTLL
jgi:hypothetical protein